MTTGKTIALTRWIFVDKVIGPKYLYEQPDSLKKNNTNLSQSHQKIEAERTLPNSFVEFSICLIPKVDYDKILH